MVASRKITHRPLPHEQDIPLKYQDQDEPMSGPPSQVAKAPEAQRVGYDLDPCLDWEALQTRLNMDGFRLNADATVDFVAPPDLPDGIELAPRQFLVRPKAYAGTINRRRLIGTINSEGLSEYQKKVARCLVDPSVPKTELKALGAFVKEWEIPEDELSDRNWRGATGFSPSGYVPKKMIPAASQFSEGVRRLEFGDIFTIFTGASLEQLKLFLGRVALGPNGTIDPLTKEKLLHTYRNILVVDGQLAGQGKSTIFGMLAKALKRVGFDVNQTPSHLSGRFNHHASFTSDYILNDDITSEHLGKELSSPNAKILATNGWVATEQKGIDAVNTKCTAAMMVLANRTEQRLFWGMDDGMRSRVTLVATEPEGSVASERLPMRHIPSLAKELGVEEDTIMLWAMRLAADEFSKYINENAHKLEERVKELADMANTNAADPLDGALAGLAMGYILEKGELPPKNINKDVISTALKGLLGVKQSPAVAKLLGDLVKIPQWSPAQGCRWINPRSILTAHHIITSGGVSTTDNKLIKAVFEALSLRDGNQCYGSPSVVLPRWTRLVENAFTIGRIKDLCDKMMVEYAPLKGRFHADVDFNLDIFWSA